MKPIIIFDFDGTLADTIETITQITNRLSPEFGYPETTQAELTQLQQLTTWDNIKRSKISIFKLPFVLRRLRQELSQQIQKIHVFDDIPEALMGLKEQGYSLYIITSNTEENVKAVLERYNLFSLFSKIYSRSSLFGKARLIRKLLKQENLSPQQAIYVGDETRDIDAAQRAKIRVIAVTWGFNSSQVLDQHNPDLLIDQPNELISAIHKLS